MIYGYSFSSITFYTQFTGLKSNPISSEIRLKQSSDFSRGRLQPFNVTFYKYFAPLVL